MRDYFADYSQRLQLEKLVIGLEEPIFIKGIGDFTAKVDSGNGGYNVIHGEDVYQNGGVLVFKTYDKDNELKQVSKKLLQFINVNIGSGKVEQRPVIELDVKIGDREYNQIPFSVANRSSNSHKVLICKDFIQNQLDALIDVSGKMLTQKGVEVEYLNEANILLRGLQSLAAGFQGAGKYTDASIIGVSPDDVKNVKKATEYEKIINEDRKIILRRLGLSDANALVYKLIDYQGKYYNSDKVCEAELAHFQAFQKGNKSVAQTQSGVTSGKSATPVKSTTPRVVNAAKTPPANQAKTPPASNSTLRGDSFEYKLIKKILLEDAQQTLSAPKVPATTPQKPAAGQQPNPATKQTQTPEQANTREEDSQYKFISDLYNIRRQRFCVYFIQAKQGIKSQLKKYDNEIKKELNHSKFPQKVNTFFKNQIAENRLTFSIQSGNDRIRQYFLPQVEFLSETNLSKNTQTTFAICFGNLGQRKIWLSNTNASIDEDEDPEERLEELVTNSKGSGIDEKIVKKFEQYYEGWKANDILKHQNLDLNQPQFNKQLAKSITSYVKAVQNPDTDFMTLVKSDFKQSNATPVDLHLKEIFAEEQNPGYVQKQLDDANNIVAGINALVSNQLSKNRKQKASPDCWKQLLAITYEGLPLDQAEQTSEEEPDENLKQWQNNVLLNYILQQVGGDISQLDDNDKAKVANLIQQRIDAMGGNVLREGWKNNAVLKEIAQHVNLNQLSAEDKAAVANLIQKRVNTLQQVAIWQKNIVLKSIMQHLPIEQIDDESKALLSKLIQNRIVKLQQPQQPASQKVRRGSNTAIVNSSRTRKTGKKKSNLSTKTRKKKRRY